ncbi:MAG TPA: primosomal protein N' [Steroidobacteraceae bacterium]|nr:primosomal protein N' [Steroidobacteraceae bacterium]
MSSFLQIALDTPLRRVFDYRCPEGIDGARLQPGTRVRVPFGQRRLIGILLKTSTTSDVPAAKLKAAIEVLDDEPLFDPTSFELLCWAADYYRHPIGEVFAAALPVPLRTGATLDAQVERWRLTEQGMQEWQSLPARSSRLRGLAAAVAREAGSDELSTLSPTWRAGLRELESRGWVRHEIVAAESIAPTIEPVPGHDLSDLQRDAVDRILACYAEANSFRTFLLHGVTGSGKTEVYLRVIEKVIADNRQALVLVPEIALTPQLVERFQQRFQTRIAALHSQLTDAERLAAWRAARSGAARIVIGTRSAIFASLPHIGIIIVDEEHDPSYKQQEGFRYSARDLAIVRAQRHGIPVVLGSATPSLESLSRADKQPGSLLSLPTRAGNAKPPLVRVVDLRKHAGTDGISTPTMQAIKHHLERNGQVLLYLNRRGFAPVLFCPSCGWSAACRRCDARMTVHARANKLICHHCGQEESIHERCASCDSPVKPVGEGTERIEETVARLFPGVTTARIDRDSIRRKGELEATLAQIHDGSVRILIGTQMLTKGHHFPNVTLVVVLDADQGLFGTDFRAAERLAQNIVQVSGRAGRAERSGEVIIQTEFPEHPLLISLLQGGYSGFAAKALQEREHAHWPPFARLALLRAEAASMTHAMEFLHRARDIALQSGARGEQLRILGPVAAPMARRAGRYRAQLLLQAPSHAPLQKLMPHWLAQLEVLPQAKKVRWSIDIDPLELF